MGKVAIGMFEDASAAQAAVRELESVRFTPADVQVVTSRTDFESGPPIGGPLEDLSSESGMGAGTAIAGAAYHAGIIRALTRLGVPEHSSEEYAEGVRRGAALVIVKSEGDRADEAAAVMDRNRAIRVEERVSAWEASGWQRQFRRAAEGRGMSPGRREAETVQVGRDRANAGGARVFVW